MVFGSRRRRQPAATAPAPQQQQPQPQAPPQPRSFWPAFPPRGYLGQLDPAFQRTLRQERQDLTLADCEWYHSVDLSDGSSIRGAWDLRGAEPAYLGETDITGGQRILEFGPASGHLTFWMEERGAEVVGLDAGYDVSIDILPVPGNDLRDIKAGAMRAIGAVQNSWWYLHRDRGSNASAVYAPIYDLPADLGMFDVSVYGAILLHLRDPFTALAEGARRTHNRIVVTDVLQDDDVDPEANVMRPDPLGAREHRTNWWAIFPGAVKQMLKRLDFGNSRTIFHTQKHHLGHNLDEPPVDMKMWTVIADRS